MSIKEYSMWFLAFLFVLGYFLTVYVLFMHPEYKSSLDVFLGGMQNNVAVVLGYYFGSSSGSRDKDKLMVKP